MDLKDAYHHLANEFAISSAATDRQLTAGEKEFLASRIDGKLASDRRKLLAWHDDPVAGIGSSETALQKTIKRSLWALRAIGCESEEVKSLRELLLKRA